MRVEPVERNKRGRHFETEYQSREAFGDMPMLASLLNLGLELGVGQALWTAPGEILEGDRAAFVSTRAWVLVVRPPRLRPTQRSPLFFWPGGVLMDAYNRTAIVSLDDSIHQTDPR